MTRAHHVWHDGVQRRVADVVSEMPDDTWQRVEVGAGSKGPRVREIAGGNGRDDQRT